VVSLDAEINLYTQISMALRALMTCLRKRFNRREEENAILDMVSFTRCLSFSAFSDLLSLKCRIGCNADVKVYDAHTCISSYDLFSRDLASSIVSRVLRLAYSI